MRASERRNRISLQRPASGEDEIGQPSTGWVEVRKAWASIEMQGGREALRAGAVASAVQGVMQLRFCKDIESSWRVVFGETAYNILAIRPDNVRKESVDLIVEVIA